MNKNINKSNFSKNLTRIRKAKGLSQQELANLSGLSQRIINYYENDINKSIIDNIVSIAKALNIGINELIETEIKEKEINKTQNEVVQFDIRTIQKLKPILSLSKDDRYIIYTLIEALLAKQEKQSADSKK